MKIRTSAVLQVGYRLNGYLSSYLGSMFLFLLVLSYLWGFVETIHGRGEEGLLIYPAERILAGQVPYRDFFSELAPGTFYIQALSFKLFGTYMWSARVPVLLIMAAIGWQLFHLSREIMPAWAATIPVLIYSVTGFSRWVVVSHHWYSMFFALAAAILLVRFLQRRQNGWLFLAGICTAATGICMQSKGAFCLLGIVAVLVMDHLQRHRKGWRAMLASLTWYLLGVFVLVLIPLYYFYRQNALRDLIYSTTVYLWQSYLPYDYLPLPFLPSTVRHNLCALAADFSISSFGKFFATMAASLIVPLASIICVIRAVRGGNGLDPDKGERRPLLFTYLVLGLALMLSEMHRYDLVHMYFGFPLLLVLAITLLYDLGFRPVPASGFASWLLVCLIVFSVGHGLSLAWREGKRNSPIHTRRGTFYQTRERAERYQTLVNEVQSRASADSSVFFYPYSSTLYFLTATSNPTRFDYLLPGQTTAAQFEEVIKLLSGEQAPPLILSFWKERKNSLPRLFPNAPQLKLRHHPIEDFLLSGEGPYRKAFENASFIIFKRVVP